MKRLDSHITKFEGSAGKSDHYSIYQKHYQVTPDAQDSMKVCNIREKFCKPRKDKGIGCGFGKQISRD